MRIALATCSALPDWEVDDEALRQALSARQVEFDEPAWDDVSIDWSGFDAVVVRTTWDYVAKAGAFRDWLVRCAAATRLFNPIDVLLWNLDKRYLRDLAERGVPTVPTLWLDDPEDLDRVDWREWLRGFGAERGFAKPVVGASGSGTLRFGLDASGFAAAERHLHSALVDESLGGILVQPYQRTVEGEGEVSAIMIDGRITHGVVKRPVPGDYRVQDDHGGTDAPHAFAPDEKRLIGEVLERAADAVARACGRRPELPLLYARADFLRRADGGLQVVELELVEPSLFFRHGPDAASAMAEAIQRRVAAAQ